MKRGRTLRAALMGAAAVLGSSVLASSAWADTTTILLDNPNSAIAGFPAPYAQVTIDLVNSTTANVTFTTVFSGVGGLYLMGDGGSADLNVSTTYTLSNVVATNDAIAQLSGFSDPVFLNNTPGTVDGFGKFNLSLNLFDGYTQAADTISFTLTDTGTAWANAASVLTPNNQGATAAAHIFVCFVTNSACDPSGTAPATGFAANGGAVNVPAPAVGAGLPGLVMACGGLIALARRRRQKVV
jgi:hypothetical protein